jgi:uncharacterized protein (TIGR02453 family)
MTSPQFAGFPKRTLAFLRALEKNNEKAWFDANRGDYDEYYVAPAKTFVVAAGAALAKIAPDISAEPKVNGSIFRINRDVRFAKDKTPYKTHLMLRFWQGPDRKKAASGFYLRLGAKTVGIGVGAHAFDKSALARYRKAVAGETSGKALVAAVKRVERAGYSLEGEHYKKVPRGFDADPDSEAGRLLRHNGLWIGNDEKLPAVLHSKGFVRWCVDRWKKMKPLHDWLVDELE